MKDPFCSSPMISYWIRLGYARYGNNKAPTAAAYGT